MSDKAKEKQLDASVRELQRELATMRAAGTEIDPPWKRPRIANAAVTPPKVMGIPDKSWGCVSGDCQPPAKGISVGWAIRQAISNATVAVLYRRM